jgi:hypothetical protein
VEGLIFISMDEKSQHEQSQKALQPSSRAGASSSGEVKRFKRRPQSVPEFQLPPASRSLVAGATEQLFWGCFMSSYHTSVVHWPSRYIENSTSPALKFAMRAGTMAFYGNLTKNVALQTDAGRWYSKAIQLEMGILAAKASKKRGAPRTVNPDDILTPMILALFESAMCISPMGWAHHLTAAAKLLEVLGPEHCQKGAMHDIFRSVRLNMVSLISIF